MCENCKVCYLIKNVFYFYLKREHKADKKPAEPEPEEEEEDLIESDVGMYFGFHFI